MTDIEVANEPRFPCDRCEAVYPTPQGLGIHKRSAHGIVGRTHAQHKRGNKAGNQREKCPECGEYYQAKYLNYKHLPTAHGVRVATGTALVPVISTQPKPTNGLTFSVEDEMIILRDSRGRRWVAELFPN